ncbi:hypothetical protein CHU_0631 [Cytophaga hutchinsonii ATCC 33406]|uniref:Uncharacterized protein n=1 Tax=Cytophaga hutchinsonii (strain ATCC 33406 / DSM 1761 / CIP 103989 / NBRC 15051 / NCIMB 9469 / D465) TaxID=269798 RepID=A0A6N4SNP2_CYTH3|nr:hypothetical protein CHU_0631 [Cytophaga hutchinsonii ATCC 33406]
MNTGENKTYHVKKINKRRRSVSPGKLPVVFKQLMHEHTKILKKKENKYKRNA